MKDFVDDNKEVRDGVPDTVRCDAQDGLGCRRSNLSQLISNRFQAIPT